jgi:protein TonB
MLEDSLLESGTQHSTRKPVTLVVSVIAHIVTVVVLVLIPLISEIQAITVRLPDMPLWMRKLDVPKPVEVFSVQPRIQKYTESDPNILTAPESIPSKILYVEDAPRPAEGLLPAIGNDNIGSVARDVLSRHSDTELPPSPPPLPPPPPAKADPIRVSAGAQQAELVHQVNPTYPPLARQAHVQGVVVLEATISREGTIEGLRVVAGHPLLTPAAVDAVKQWKYLPTLLNGEPVEVITTVTVTFSLR